MMLVKWLEGQTVYAIAFDLDTDILSKTYGNSSYTNAKEVYILEMKLLML